MKCYYHADRESVGTCKSCCRGLCMECAADVPPGLACRGKCEPDVASLNKMLERNKSAYGKTGAAYARNAVATLIFGLIFVGFGLLSGKAGSFFMVPLGCVFLLWSFFSYRSGKQISAEDFEDSSKK